MKIELVPEFLEGLTRVLFSFEELFELKDDKKTYTIASLKDENRRRVQPVSFYLEENDTISGLEFEWADSDVDYDLNKRVYPKGIYWLIDTLKKIYNEWQKEHTNHPKLK
jgi:hypothetical protein